MAWTSRRLREFGQSADWKSEELSAKFAVATGARSLDTLHVAAARIIGVKVFVSFDNHQRQMADRAGLNVLP